MPSDAGGPQPREDAGAGLNAAALPATDELPPVHLNRHFRLLWLVRTLDQTGANTAQFGSLIVIVEVTGSGFLSSLLVLSWVLPAALTSIGGGALTEIVDVRVVLGLAPIVLLFAWIWAQWGRPDRLVPVPPRHLGGSPP